MTAIIDTLSPDPSGNFTPPPAEPPPPVDPPPHSIDVRDTGVALSLSGISIEAARALLTSVHRTRRVRVLAQCDTDVERRRIAEQHAETALTHARSEAATVASYLRRKSALEDRVRQLAIIIRTKRHALEAQKIAGELSRLDGERSDAIERLGAERLTRHKAAVESWTQRENERTARIDELRAQREELAANERTLRDQAALRMNPWMTRGTSGFLVWSGYTVIGTTGIAVASLLIDTHGRSLLTDVAISAVHLLTEFRAYPFVHPLLWAIGSLLAFLASLVGVLVGIDLLMRWFDKRWMKAPPSNPHVTIPTKAELGRSTFSKLLITIPLIYIAGSLVAFIAYGGRVTSSRLLLGESTAVLHTLIGSALSLLSASMFVLYFATILEPRAKTQWRTVWEIGIVPFVMVLAIVFAAIFGPDSRWAWAGITTFMLLGAMALAYGLLYRGMFAQIDYAARATAYCEREIEATREPPEVEQPDRFEQQEIVRVMADYRTRRQQLLDFDRQRRIRRMLLTSDERDTSLVAGYQIATSFLWRVLVRWRRVPVQPDFYHVTDIEAAPGDAEDRQKLEQEIREIDLDLAALVPDQTRKHVADHERDAARAERERAERDHPLSLATNDERESTEKLEFESAYAIAASMKTSYDTVTRRRDENAGTATRPRAKRPRQPRAEEEPNGH